MHASLIPLLAAALPLALAAPQGYQGYASADDDCTVQYVTEYVTVTAGEGATSIPPVDLPEPTSVQVPASYAPKPSSTSINPVTSDAARPTADAAADTVKSLFPASTTYDFGALQTLPADIWISKDFISSEPLTHTFKASNVAITDGFLVLTVPGGQAGQSDISSGEISTTFDVKYASVRTFAILTEEPGVCNGMFFYQSDSQETDIEWISDPSSQSNKFANNGTRAMQYTNQALNGNPEDATSKFGRAPEDATSAVHEYRIDWFEDRTEFFLDGVFQYDMTTNVPNVAGPWVWNNWANGNPEWTADPPVNDAIFKIQKIEMYYNPA